MEDKGIQGKRRARSLAVQALYQWMMAGVDLYEIETQFRVAKDMEKVDTTYFCQLLYGVPKEVTRLEEAFIPFLDRPLADLNPIELTVLRISTYELLNCPELPFRVILDEAVNLTKRFGSQDGYRYVNGVLNNLARVVRVTEVGRENE